MRRRQFLHGLSAVIVGLKFAQKKPRTGGFGSSTFGSKPFGA